MGRGRLRIIAGALKGRKLHTLEGETVRPTAERVREALFDILGDRILDADFLDVYAGTGAVGIEALSRGCASATFIEKQREVVNVLRLNLEALDHLAGRARVLPHDVARSVAVLEREGRRFDVVYLDPPYAGGELERALRLLSRSMLVRDSSILVAEHESDTIAPRPERLEPFRTAVYGRAALTFYRALTSPGGGV